MPSPVDSVRFVALADDDGRRLDQVLAARVPSLSRRRARVLIDIGGVFVDRVRVKVASRIVRVGQTLEAYPGGALERATKAVGREARAKDAATLPQVVVLDEDDAWVIVDKPAGLLTAPTPESDRTNLADHLARRDGHRARIWVVHRLDLFTSGVMVFAKSAAANRVLAEVFRRHDVERDYDAVVAGRFGDGMVRSELALRGRQAATRFVTVERFGDRATRLSCTLETGRTHQIRLHARALGHPVLGDTTYGKPTPYDPPRIALHAAHLALAHPVSGQRRDFVAPLPQDLTDWLADVRRSGDSRDGDVESKPLDEPDTL